MKAHVRGNLLFPQTSAKISLPIIANYLESAGSATTFLREPGREELGIFGRAMNAAHSGYGIKHRTSDVRETSGQYEVMGSRLNGLIKIYNRQALRDLLRVAKIFGAQISPQPNEAGARFIDEIFIDPKSAEVAASMIRFGGALTSTLSHPLVLQQAKKFRRAVATANKDRPLIDQAEQDLQRILEGVFAVKIRREIPLVLAGAVEHLKLIIGGREPD